jgi:phosphohistidine phosphatase
MKTLFVMRHAKSSWENADLSDFERPLNERGLRAAPFMGALMREKNFAPDLILSSPARRAKETAETVKRAANFSAAIKFDERIYEASPHALVYLLAETGNEFSRVLLVGHNPGLEGLIKILTGKLEAMPTAALAEIELNVENWSEISTDCGRLISLIRPKEEMKSRAV